MIIDFYAGKFGLTGKPDVQSHRQIIMKNTILLFFAGLILSMQSYAQPQRESDVNSPDKAKLDSMTAAINSQQYPNIHSVLISYRGNTVFERYFKGEDEEWGQKKGLIAHGPTDLHDLRSCSKSVVSACTGIAISKGMIKSINQRVMEFFPEYKSLDTGLRSKLTLEHLLTMSSGILWNEEVPYDNPLNSEIRMTSSPDPTKYVLSQPFTSKPGDLWSYNGGTTQLLAAVIKKVSGLEIDVFAVRYLFGPLGITNYEWKKFPGLDLPAAASGLRLTSRDMLKFGLLYLNDGVYDKKRILEGQWVNESMKTHISRGRGEGYGYQFWMMDSKSLGGDYMLPACVGNGDQRIFIDQKKQLVVVVTAGNYNKWDIPKGSFELLADYIYPALR